MAPQALSREQIGCLVRLTQDAFAAVEAVRRSNPLGACIQQPKIPTLLSESIVHELITTGALLPHLQNATLCRGGRVADIIATIDHRTIRVEVKATARSGFSHLYQKDTTADYLVWVAFEDFFESGGATHISIFTLNTVQRHFPAARKITLKDFRRIAGADIVETRYQLAEASIAVATDARDHLKGIYRIDAEQPNTRMEPTRR